jgi:hypothetical protein
MCRSGGARQNEESWLDLQILFQRAPAVIKMRATYDQAKLGEILASSVLCRASRRNAPYSGTLLVKPYERLSVLVTLFIGMD